MRHDLGLDKPEDTVVGWAAPDAASDLTHLGAAELEKRLEECYNQHKAALRAKQWAAAAALGSTLNRLTDALKAVASSGGA